MVLLDEQPFGYVEYQGFRKFMSRVCPIFEMPSRKTVREDCFRLFLENKNLLSAYFKRCQGGISLAIDVWTSSSNTNKFLLVSAHFIGEDWKVHRRIISFAQIASDLGSDIGETLALCLEEWNIKDVLCVTMNNASADDAANALKHKLKLWGTDFLNSKYLHVSCVTKVVNLVVTDELKEMNVVVERVREAIRWVMTDADRYERFKFCIKMKEIKSNKPLSVDVPAQWSSTYIMLEVAEKYEVAFRCFEDLHKNEFDNETLGFPSSEDWKNVRILVEYLKVFYDLTLRVSSTTNVTTHLFFKELCDLYDAINDLESSDDLRVQEIAVRIKSKVDTYWFEKDNDRNVKMNRLFYIATVLDPRHKLEYIELAFSRMYENERGGALAKEVKEAVCEMFESYKQQPAVTPCAPYHTSSREDDNAPSSGGRTGRIGSEFKKRKPEVSVLDRS
ncbi:Zinc finger BED domain-containing protein RICESLEEPER 2 [Linum grandiflorum]